jgi:hypothetical protein
MNKTQMKRLRSMLAYKRPHGDPTEREFTSRFLTPYNPDVFVDDKGETLAFVVKRGDTTANPVLWSCHVDTVHRSGGYQTVVHDKQSGYLQKDDGFPLGADDGAGVFLLLEMIDAGVPGTYIFHRGEECGGVGSRGMAKHHTQWLRQFRWAIAFDRRGTEDIITHQAAGQTASTAFAQGLALALNGGEQNLSYAPCSRGIFTDTANYADIIPECSNVSVGYDNEHTKDEVLDYWHLTLLRHRLIVAFRDGCALPVDRDPTKEWRYQYDNYGFGKGYTSYGYGKSSKATHYITNDGKLAELTLPRDAHEISNMRVSDLVNAVTYADPEEIAELLLDLADVITFGRDVPPVDDAPDYGLDDNALDAA